MESTCRTLYLPCGGTERPAPWAAGIMKPGRSQVISVSGSVDVYFGALSELMSNTWDHRLE